MYLSDQKGVALTLKGNKGIIFHLGIQFFKKKSCVIFEVIPKLFTFPTMEIDKIICNCIITNIHNVI